MTLADVSTDVAIVDRSRLPHPQPCPDCRREHMMGEHISFHVPSKDGATRVAWEGCCDCWIRRTEVNPGASAPTGASPTG